MVGMNGCAPVSCTSVRRVPAVSLPMQEQNKTVRSVYLFLGIVQIDTSLSGIDLFMVFEYNELNKSRGVLEKEKWVLCPICNNKTRIKVRPDTVLENFPLFCPKCKKETIMIISVTRHCFDNARMESFFATLKKEKIYQIAAYKLTRAQVKTSIFRYVFTYYNRIRICTVTPGGLPPVKYHAWVAAHAA